MEAHNIVHNTGYITFFSAMNFLRYNLCFVLCFYEKKLWGKEKELVGEIEIR